MNLMTLAIPIHLAGLFVLGTCLGSLANLGAYRLAWHPRSISPWSHPDPNAPRRRRTDRMPIIGWLGLRREAAVHGTGFWIRPMAVELLAGLGLAALYWWEVGCQGLLPPDAPRLATPAVLAILHVQFAAHVLLICLMLVASMIDLDEKIIPDTITVPGTLLGLLLASVYPWVLLPEFVPPLNEALRAQYWQFLSADTWQVLQPASPEMAPHGVLGVPHLVPQGIRLFPQAWLLAVGLGCWWLWCVALMPRVWYSRYGWRRAGRYFVAKLIREPATYRILVMGLIGSAAVTLVWLRGGPGWTGLLSALVGMAASGGIVWAVRIVGTATLRREAMGFGDVTLMAMVGTFVGWQTGLMIFFLAPLGALGVGLLRLILLREREIPYGPYLCLATVAAIVGWAALWDRTWHVFTLGWFVPVVVVICLMLMAAMLGLWQWVRGLLV